MRTTAVLALAAGVALSLTASAAAKPGDLIVGDSDANEVVRVDPKTGATTLISDDSRFADPNDTVFGPDGMIYVADYGAFADNGGVFRVNPENGNTRVVSDDPLFQQPDGIALGPNGDLFVTEIQTTNGALFRVKLPSGNTSVVSDDPLLDGGPIGVVVPPSGVPFVADTELLARVNPLTGDATTVADTGDGLVAGDGLTRAPDGTLYMADFLEGVQAIDPRTGEITDLSGPVPYSDYGMAFDFKGRVLLTADNEINAVNVRTGAVDQITDELNFAEGLEVEPPRCGGLTATIVGTTKKDKLKGSRFADVIASLGGADVIKAGAGKDVICSGSGNDQLNGGSGKDRCKGQAGRDRERKC